MPPDVRRALRLPSTRARLLRELDDEIRFHVEHRVERLRAGGMSAEDAYIEALRRFGDMDDLREYCQSIEVTNMRRMELRERVGTIVQDVRFALRQARKSPGFSLVAVLTLALGIGATTAIFSVVSGVLLKPLPFFQQERLVQVWSLNAKHEPHSFADPTFDAVAKSTAFSAIAEFSGLGSMTLASNGTAFPASTAYVSSGFFDVFGLRPSLGRLFVPQEQQLGAAPAAVISYEFWQRQFGGSARAIGATLQHSGSTVTIVGVLPRGLIYPSGAEMLLPREIYPRYASYTAHNWRVAARLAPGTTLESARADVSSIMRRLKAEIGDYDDSTDGSVVSLREQIVGQIRPMLLLIFGASVVLLVIACANVINLLVARLASREGEIAVRLALGAGRARLAQQLLVESGMLALFGCIGGLVLAVAGVQFLVAARPASLPRMDELGVDWRVLAFAVGVSAAAALALGLFAAWRGVGGNIRGALANSQRSQGGGGASYRVRGTLVVAQLAMTMVLLAGGAVLTRSFVRLMTVDAGFHARNAVTVNLLLDRKDNDPATLARRDQFIDAALAGLRTLPGVTAAGGATALPLTDGAADGTFVVLDDASETPASSELERMAHDKSRAGSALYELASPGYFRALGIPLISGRDFNDGDRNGAPNVAVVSAALAKKQWPGQNALGHVIEFGNMDGDLTPMTVVGVVGDVYDRSLSAAPYPALYGPYDQRPGNGDSFSIVLVTSTPAATITSARNFIRQLAPAVPVRFGSLDEIVSRSVAPQRFMLVLVGVFAAVALLLAALGVYSVIAYLVAQRERELSIRVALGARGADVARLVMMQGVSLALGGAAVGGVGAVLSTRLLAHMLFATSATDPVAFGCVIVLLGVVALVASWVPARRAARADPMDALRAG
jgi:putative ABC transport system permease protein